MASKSKTHVRNDRQVRQAQILDEAIRIIGERGYHGFAVQELAERCGLTTGGLLYHFKTKEGLFLAVLGEFELRIEAALQPLIDDIAEQDLRDGTFPLSVGLSLLRALLKHSVSEPDLMRLDAVLHAEALHPAHPGHDHYRKRHEQTTNLITRTITDHTSDPASAARHIYALMVGLEHQWLWRNGDFHILAEFDRAIAAILRGPLPGGPE